MGKIIKAEEYYKKGLAIAQQIGDREQTCVLLLNLGDLIGEKGDYAQAEEYLQEGLGLARQINHREWIIALLINLGENVEKKSNNEEAEKYFQEEFNFSKTNWTTIFYGSSPI